MEGSSPTSLGDSELASLNTTHSLIDLDPCAHSDSSVQSALQQPTRSAPQTPFTKAFGPHTRTTVCTVQPLPPLPSPPPLIDISGPTPPRPPPSFTAVRRPSPLKFSFFDDSFDMPQHPDSGETTPSGVEPAPFANLSPPPTVRRLSPSSSGVRAHEETENLPVPCAQPRPAQRRWSAITRLQEERRKAATLAPPAHDSPLKEGDSSMILSPVNLGADDLSLIADEGGSFLLRQQDATLDSFALSQSTEADDSAQKDDQDRSDASEPSGGMSVLLRGLGESTIGQARFPSSSSSWAPSFVRTILPSDLTSSTRTIKASSSSPAPRARQPSFDPELSFLSYAADEPSHGGGSVDVSLLNASTASFASYRASPAKPRVVSLEAERWSPAEAEEDPGRDTARTPRPRGGAGRVSDTSASSGSGTEEGPSRDSFDLTRWRTAELGTGILDQSPPTAALRAESTKTLELVLQSPLQPTKVDRPPLDASTSTLACSTRTVMELDSPFRSSPSQESGDSLILAAAAAPPAEPAIVVAEGDLLGLGNIGPSPPRRPPPAARPPPNPPSAPATTTKETGADRLKRRLEELRAQKKATGAPSAAVGAQSRSSASSSATSSTSATPSRRMSLRPPGTGVAPAQGAGRLARPRASMLPAPTTSSSSSSSSSAAAPKTGTPPLSASSPAAPSADAPKTPGERKDSTAARLERLRSERKQREMARGTPCAAGAGAGTGLTRSNSAIVGGRTAVRTPALARGGAVAAAPPRPGSTTTGLTRSRSLVAASSRPLVTGAAAVAAPSPRKPPAATAAAPRPSLLLPPSTAPARRRSSIAPATAAAPLKFASMAAPSSRVRVPLAATQPSGAGAGAGAGAAMGGGGAKPRVSRIGLGQASATTGRR